jgi:hypothetical protein
MTPSFALAKEINDPVKKEERMARLAQLEERIYQRASGVLEAVLSFHEVAPSQQEPPPDWVAEYGAEGAQQRLAVAKTGWLPASLAPNAPRLALQFVTAVRRAQGRQQMLKPELNVKISLPAPTSSQHPTVTTTYETRELDE